MNNGLTKLIASVGIPGAIAFYLLYFLTNRLGESLTKIEAVMTKIEGAVQTNTMAIHNLGRFLEKLTTGP